MPARKPKMPAVVHGSGFTVDDQRALMDLAGLESEVLALKGVFLCITDATS